MDIQRRRHDMTSDTQGPGTPHRRYWKASQTWNVWNKFTAADFHNRYLLRDKGGFEGQNILFCGNHPIRYFRLMGVVVNIDLKFRYCFLSLDDSSGACVDVKITLRQVSRNDGAVYPSNTLVDEVNVLALPGEPSVMLNNKPVGIGSVIKVKGTLSVFRDVRQIDLKRMFHVANTNAEAAAWAETVQWKRDVLSKPWILSAEKRIRIDQELAREEKRLLERSRKRKASHDHSREERQAREAKREAKRKRDEAKFNAGALERSHIIRHPGD